jgi:hypothetical protein
MRLAFWGRSFVRREAKASAEAGLVFGSKLKESTILLCKQSPSQIFFRASSDLNTLYHQRHHLFTDIITKPLEQSLHIV